MSNAPIVKGSGAETIRDGFADRSVERTFETSSSMVAAQAQAIVQARYVMALKRPRDPDTVRVRLLHECKRPGFAARAFYQIPRRGAVGRLTGTKGVIEGLSVRFAEAAIRMLGNILQDTHIVYDDDYKRMLRVEATDLENNACYGRSIIIDKTIERSKTDDGDVILGTRTNSAGHPVYILQANEADLLVKESGMVSRMFRTEALRFVESDTLEECERQIIATVRAEIKADPDSERKKLADSFAAIHVMPDDLREYLGHDLAQCSPAELEGLRGLYTAIKEGSISWAELVDEKSKPPEEQAATSKAKRLAEELKAKRAAAKAQGPQGSAPLSKEEQEKLRAAEAHAKAKREREPGEEG